jgi:hypothetical protein
MNQTQHSKLWRLVCYLYTGDHWYSNKEIWAPAQSDKIDVQSTCFGHWDGIKNLVQINITLNP